MNVIQGDLIKLALEGYFDVIIHGCNCQCTMGAGIAKSIKTIFPEAYQADLATEKGDSSKLGTISTAKVERNGHNLVIVNAYTQFHWRGKGILVDYDAIASVMKTVKLSFPQLKIGYPKIGAGLAKGNWEIISEIIDSALEGTNHTLVEFKPTISN